MPWKLKKYCFTLVKHTYTHVHKSPFADSGVTLEVIWVSSVRLWSNFCNICVLPGRIEFKVMFMHFLGSVLGGPGRESTKCLQTKWSYGG